MGKRRRKSKGLFLAQSESASGLYGYPDIKQRYTRDGKPSATPSSSARKEIPTPGIGYAASHEGRTVGHTIVAGHFVNHVISECTCGGENPNCFKCDGTGYSLIERIGNEVPLRINKKNKRTKSIKRPVPIEASFSNDSRGGTYAIREQGRFLSNPEHDDYGDESTS